MRLKLINKSFSLLLEFEDKIKIIQFVIYNCARNEQSDLSFQVRVTINSGITFKLITTIFTILLIIIIYFLILNSLTSNIHCIIIVDKAENQL